MFQLPKEDGTDGGARTHTALRPPDFESGASANSATSARNEHTKEIVRQGAAVDKSRLEWTAEFISSSRRLSELLDICVRMGIMAGVLVYLSKWKWVWRGRRRGGFSVGLLAGFVCVAFVGGEEAGGNSVSKQGDLDRFVASAAKERGLALSSEAKRRVLLRRLSFDLTGLPPEERWLGEEDSVEKFVDALIASPRFGERMASMWMNVARYAEDQAHLVDDRVETFYPNAYLYRQWVVDAFNADMSFDRFVKLQLAADLYEFARREDLPALGFIGLGPKYYQRNRLEVMADEWEDRVDTVTRGFLGLTVACARCHDHKFDPISTEDYYALAGVFASTELVNVPYGEAPEEVAADDKGRLLYTTHIVREAEPRDLNVFVRGDVERKGPVAPRRFLSLFYEGEPPTFAEGSGRKELAEAIASPENPLTAKVFVNRVWQMFFGHGLVRTSSNFGALGEPPSHPGLLEHLAKRFVNQGGSTKRMVREIVLSATYRQSSRNNEAFAAMDSENRYLWRMNRRRLTVEMWRDSLLFVAGNLDYEGGRSMELDDPQNRRRTLYGRVSRLKLNSLLQRYDYPDPNVHSGKRAVTTTPLQKLFSLNSEFVIKQARIFARRMQREADNNRDRIRKAYRSLFFREPGEEELRLGLEFLDGEGESNSRWDLYAQTLLISNEALYLD